MNEFCETLRDQASHFLSRDEYTAARTALVRDMDSTRIELSKYAMHVEEFDKTTSVERAQLDKRLDQMNEFRARLNDQAVLLIDRMPSWERA